MLLLLLLLLLLCLVGAFLLYNNCFCTRSKTQQVKGHTEEKKVIKMQNTSFLLFVDFLISGYLNVKITRDLQNVLRHQFVYF